MLYSWYDFALLGLESSSVIQKRLLKIGCGGTQSLNEIELMFSEKRDAACESAVSLAFGSTFMEVVDQYRVRVAANEARLS